ncbi:MAG TPA: radical SAM protein, partial [Thermoleophilia bacterium]|nr:radical SAM protein [Thermoleophilia bacterium]
MLAVLWAVGWGGKATSNAVKARTLGTARTRSLKIRLIEPAPPSINILSYGFFPRLGLPVIGAALKAAGHDVLIYCPQAAPIDRDDVASADLVGISTTTSTAPAAFALADELRAAGIRVVMGGPHPTFGPWDAMPHADFVARGEGELESIRGLSFWRDGRPVHNELRDPPSDLDSVPAPDLSLIVGAERIYETPIMTSLGCPFDCTFCTVTLMFGRKYRCRSPEHVVAELEAKRPKEVFFYDDNFAANKKRLKVLLNLMIERGVTMPWLAQVRADVARDEELLELMRRSGCRRLALGFESIDQVTLDGYAKSQTVEDIVRAIDALHRHGIKIHGMFVVGADSDTARTAADTVAFAERHGVDTLMLNVLTPGLGTKQYEMMDAGNRIFETRWQFYDGQHPIYVPQNMTPLELQTTVVEGYRHFYSLRRALRYLVRLRFADLVVHLWGWVYIRRWQKEPANQAYVAELAAGSWEAALADGRAAQAALAAEASR